MKNVEEKYELAKEQIIRSNEEKPRVTFISVNGQSDGLTTQNDSQITYDANTYKVNEWTIKNEKVESEDYHKTMVEIHEGTRILKKTLSKKKLPKILPIMGYKKHLTADHMRLTKWQSKLKMSNRKISWWKFKKEWRISKKKFPKTLQTMDLKIYVTASHTKLMMLELKLKKYNRKVQSIILNGTEDIKDNFIKEKVTEDLTDNGLGKTFDGNPYIAGLTCIDTEVQVEVKNSGLLDLHTTNYKNTLIDNRTRNEENKKTYDCYFESRIITNNNKETATKYNNEDITKQRFFQCDLCQKMSKTKKQITLHILKFHKSSTNKRCPQKLNPIHCNKFTKAYTNINRPL